MVLSDAVSSSSNEERTTALRRLQEEGIVVNSIEGWIFETLQDANHAE